MRDHIYRPYSFSSQPNIALNQGPHNKKPTKQGPSYHLVQDHPGPYPRGSKGGWDCPSPANLTSVPYNQQHQLPPPQRHTGPSSSPVTSVPQPRFNTAQPGWKTQSRSGAWTISPVRNVASLHVWLGIQSSNQFMLFPEVRLVKILCNHYSRNYLYMTILVLAGFLLYQ